MKRNRRRIIVGREDKSALNNIDPATGKVYGRELVAADRVKDYLKYSDRAGNEMIDDAVQLAQVRYFSKKDSISACYF